ncbi:MAG: efflux RND transporter periplasmic adaptor subunit [Bacteroidota bacterium]|nr:efflux RND transporter periplasmic adaptor subunit [Bacteroidota bacterium]
MKKLFNYLFIPLLFAGLGSCKEKAQQQIPSPEITVVEVIQKDVPVYRQFVGQVYGLKDIPIRARVEGFLEGLHFDEGTRIQKGTLLYSIDPAPFIAEVGNQKGKLAEAQTMLANAESQLARYKPLAEINAVSESDLDFAQANRDASLASVEAAEATLKMAEINLSYCKIYSPITGFIGKTNAREGEFVGKNPNPVILNTVSSIDEVRVQFFLTETEYLAIARFVRDQEDGGKEEMNTKRTLKLILTDDSYHPYNGQVDFINREVDASTGAILLQATFPNPELILRPGQFARVEALMNFKEGALLVPQRCVSELQGQHSVLVVTDSNKVETRQVITGDKIGDLWMIEDGLEPKEKIIIDAIQAVRPGQEIKPLIIEFDSKNTQQ